MAGSDMTKQEARETAKKAYGLWKAASPSGPFDASETIWERVEGAQAFRKAGTVLLYMSIEGEVMTRDFISKWSGTKRIALPLVKGRDLVLKEYSHDRLKEGYRGIIEPSDNAPDIPLEEIDLAIVPGTAFAIYDSKVLRLGRGGGFYDRLLSRAKCPTIGVCYSCRLLKDLPTDPLDVVLDDLVTEKNYTVK